jgi:hypothetical protein
MFSVKKFVMESLARYTIYSMAKTVKFFLNGFGLRLASGGSEAQVERRLERRCSLVCK